MILRRTSQRGYSLIEMLVVVAIIGIISLVTIPNFVSMARSNKVKTSLRQFANDARNARQRAVTRYTRTKLGFNTGTAGARTYAVYDFAGYDTSVPPKEIWRRHGPFRTLAENTYFATPTTFIDRENDTDDLVDVIFTNTGSLDVSNWSSPPTEFKVVLRTDARLPKDQYTLDFKLAGTFTTSASNWR